MGVQWVQWEGKVCWGSGYMTAMSVCEVGG